MIGMFQINRFMNQHDFSFFYRERRKKKDGLFRREGIMVFRSSYM